MKKTFFFILFCAVSLSLWAWENQDWLTDYDWALSDGRYLLDPSIIGFDWIGFKTPVVRIYIGEQL